MSSGERRKKGERKLPPTWNKTKKMRGRAKQFGGSNQNKRKKRKKRRKNEEEEKKTRGEPYVREREGKKRISQRSDG